MSTAKREHNLPSIVYLYEEQDAGNTYYVAAKSQRDLADASQARLVGKYWLGEVSRVEMRVKRTKVKR